MDATAAWKDLLQRGRTAFNRAAFFEAHELWEDAWRTLAGAERNAVQGLIQIAAGLHHLQNGRRRPAAKLLAKGLGKLPADPLPLLVDLEVDSLAAAITRLLQQLQGPEPTPPDFPIPPLTL
jgi:predicted metal-dependent hydrolase